MTEDALHLTLQYHHAAQAHQQSTMKYLIILTLTSVASAARLDKVFLPPNSRPSSGSNVGLRTPYGSDAVVLTSTNSQAQILKYENEIDDQGWHYAYGTSDGTTAEQNGRVLPGAVPDQGSLYVTGSYSYIGDDGLTYSVSYTADENGFHPTGDHLPIPPSGDLLRNLQLTTGNDAKYDSRKSSYDADAGY